MSALETLLAIVRFLSVLALLHGIEFLILRRVYADDGVWRWQDLKKELSGSVGVINIFFNKTLSESGFTFLNIVRLAAAGLTLVNPSVWGVSTLLFIHILTLLRWRGTFNGGSDYMSLLMYICATVGMTFSHLPAVVTGCIWYITVQLCLSYFKAGYIKLKNPLWRSGQAMITFLKSNMYADHSILNFLCAGKIRMLVVSWLIIVFEVTFPLSLLNEKALWVYILIGFIFHLGNTIFLGLNRFLWTWVIGYPALIFCSTYLAKIFKF